MFELTEEQVALKEAAADAAAGHSKDLHDKARKLTPLHKVMNKLKNQRIVNNVITNPPWDLRIGGAKEAWFKLGKFVKSYSPNSVWALTGNPTVTECIDLTVKQRFKLKASSVNMDYLNFEAS